MKFKKKSVCFQPPKSYAARFLGIESIMISHKKIRLSNEMISGFTICDFQSDFNA